MFFFFQIIAVSLSSKTDRLNSNSLFQNSFLAILIFYNQTVLTYELQQKPCIVSLRPTSLEYSHKGFAGATVLCRVSNKVSWENKSATLKKFGPQDETICVVLVQRNKLVNVGADVMVYK